MSQSFSSRAAFVTMLLILLMCPFSPLSDTLVGDAQANTPPRHIYTFSDGSIENVALYQGGQIVPPKSQSQRVPKSWMLR